MINYPKKVADMPINSATALAHPNIALIKYWGDLDPDEHIPANGSISMNLRELFTRTKVSFDSSLESDEFTLYDRRMTGTSLERVSKFLDRVRQMAGFRLFAKVESYNNFPTGTGIASSASGFAALSLAASKAAGLDLDEKALSRLARTGSGSACRSIPMGFVEWQAGDSDESSYAFSIAPPEHWDIVDCIILVSKDEKPISSRLGHSLAKTSVLQPARVADAPRRLEICRKAIMNHDFELLTRVVELDSNLMHAVMLTSTPTLLYWLPATVAIIEAVQSWRKDGLPVCYTIDAGPNVHIICVNDAFKEVEARIQRLSGGNNILVTHPGGPTLLENH
jgi:diphosphomevalonate decarboxylase